MNAEHPPAVARHVDPADSIKEFDQDSEPNSIEELTASNPAPTTANRQFCADPAEERPRTSPQRPRVFDGRPITPARILDAAPAELRASVSRQTIPLTPRRAQPRRISRIDDLTHLATLAPD